MINEKSINYEIRNEIPKSLKSSDYLRRRYMIPTKPHVATYRGKSELYEISNTRIRYGRFAAIPSNLKSKNQLRKDGLIPLGEPKATYKNKFGEYDLYDVEETIGGGFIW